MAGLKIAIISAGPAGCTLARLLIRGDIHVTIFEGEANSDIRAQGGTLDLHIDTGLAALKEAGLYDEFLKYARFDGEAVVFANKNFKKYISMGGTTEKESQGRPEIDHGQLRLMLLESLPEGIIRWNHRLRSVSDDLSLHFDHGFEDVEEGFDLIVGADGAWSKVRPFVSKDQPYYNGLAGVDLRVSNVQERYPDLYKLVNCGSIFGNSDGKGICAQQKGDGSLIVYVHGRKDENWKETCGYDVHDAKAVKEALAKEFHDWAPELVRFIQVADEDNMITRSLYMLPVGNQWENKPGVTLVGDATHLMTPFAGEGDNLAMEDAMTLAHGIIGAEKASGKDALTEKVTAFEEDMFKRAAATQENTRLNMEDMFFADGTPRSVIEQYVIRAIKNEFNPVNGFFVGIIVYIYFVFLKLFN